MVDPRPFRDVIDGPRTEFADETFSPAMVVIMDSSTSFRGKASDMA